MRPNGLSMKTLTPCLPRIACSAALPVSPDVAPRMLSVSPRRPSSYSNRLPSSCIATSLNASVGPLDSASSCTPGSSVFSGTMASVPNTSAVYVFAASAFRSAAGMSSM